MLNKELLIYNIHPDVTAFTTRRTTGRNREKICQHLGIDDAHLIYPHQTHGTRIVHVDERLLSLDAERQKAELEGVDAVITHCRGICIAVSTADCIPVILYDPITHTAAAVHAGWRGTVERITEKAVAEMVASYACKASDIKAVIGPGISIKNFEVGHEVYDAFKAAAFPMGEIARLYPTNEMQEDDAQMKWHLDLFKCNELQLIAQGLVPENICIAGICTYDNTHEFFSARVEQTGSVKCGRNLNGIIIR